MTGFAEFLGAIADEGDEDDAPQIDPEAAVMELRALFERYGTMPFRPGDLVTPRRNSNIKGAGHPHIVLETRTWAEASGDLRESASFDDDSGASVFGRRLDMRVGCIADNGHIACFWVESHEFERYEAAE